MDDTRRAGGNNEIKDSKKHYMTYYRLYNGKIQLCGVKQVGFFGLVRAGCTYVAPPIEAIPIDGSFTTETRCSYFLSTRTDLQSLGAYLNAKNDNSYDLSPIISFLRSDFHIISTAVGCIQDLLIKVVIGTSDNPENSFLYSIQNMLKGIIYAILILYISILGIKIMSNPNPPQMGEVVMYVMKFALVFGMSGIGGQNIWYSHDNGKQSSPGLYVTLLDAMNSLSDVVLESTNNLAPVNMCYAPYDDGRNILAQRSIPALPSQGTIGNGKGVEATTTILGRDQNKLIITVWDFIDCKLGSYLNLNSCKYTVSGMITMWLISFCILIPGGFYISIITAAYSLTLLDIMLRFVHLSIVSMFTITILVLISPIMSCFLLFEFTKDTFKSWFKMLLGYILYPALLFSFLGIMIVTFDAIFYGQPKNPQCIKDVNCSIVDICGTSQSDNSSIYCAITSAVNNPTILNHSSNNSIAANMCSLTTSQIFNALFVSMSFDPIAGISFPFYMIKIIIFPKLLLGIIKMVFFIVLFIYMIKTIMEFFETLLQIHGISGMAPSYVGKAYEAAKAAVKKAASAYTGGQSDVAMQAVEKGKELADNATQVVAVSKDKE